MQLLAPGEPRRHTHAELQPPLPGFWPDPVYAEGPHTRLYRRHLEDPELLPKQRQSLLRQAIPQQGYVCWACGEPKRRFYLRKRPFWQWVGDETDYVALCYRCARQIREENEEVRRPDRC